MALGSLSVLLLSVPLLSGCSSLDPPAAAPRAESPAAPASPAPVPDPRLPDVLLSNLPLSGRGGYVDRDHDLQCVELRWRDRAALPAGVTVRMAAASYDRKVFRLTSTGCDDRGPSCLDFTFGTPTGPARCWLAVRTRRPVTATTDDRRIGFSGWVSCPEWLGATGCRRVLITSLDARHTVRLRTPL